MEFNDLLTSGQLAKEHTSKEKIAEFLRFSEDEIAAAKFNLNKFPVTAYKSSYDALIHAGNALIRYYGFRPTAKYNHATITECVERILGKEYGSLAKSFKRMRRKRHPLQYEADFSESRGEVKNSIMRAEELIKRIEEHMHIQPSKNRLF